MKINQIQAGKKYTDGKGSIREVLAIGTEFTAYPNQQCLDNLRYKLITKKRGPQIAGNSYNATRVAFAKWAKQETI